MNDYDLTLNFEMTPENEKVIKELLKTKGLVHYLLDKDGEELDLVEYEDYQKLENTIKEAIDYIKGAYEMAAYTKTASLQEDNIEDLLQILERTDK